jgi:uncharacterized protein (DUF58 family)
MKPRAGRRRGRSPQRRNTSSVALDANLRLRRPLYYLAAVLLLLSAPLNQPALFIIGLLLLLVVALPELWYRFGLRALVIERQPVVPRAMLGDVIDVQLVVENRKPLPLPWVEIEDEFPDQLPIVGMRLLASAKPDRARLVNNVALWAYERVRRHYYLRAVERGAYHLGPTIVRISDPFGMLDREEQLENPATLVVLPLVVPLEGLGLPAESPFGEQTTRRRLLDDPLRIAGVREYMPGDDPRWVHWKATARTGTLQSKIFEPASRHTIALFLDVQTLMSSVLGYDEDLLELAICAAASVSAWALDQGYAIGITSNGTLAGLPTKDSATAGEPRAATEDGVLSRADLERRIAESSGALRLRVRPSARPEQLGLILEGLARLLPYHGLPISRIVASERFSLPAGAAVVYIGCEQVVDVPLLITLRQLQSQGHTVSMLLTSQEDASQSEHELHMVGMQRHDLGTRARWQALRDEALRGLPMRRASPLQATEALELERRTLTEMRAPQGGSTIGEGTSEEHAHSTRPAGIGQRALQPWRME